MKIETKKFMYLDHREKKRFKMWLIKNEISITEFADNCGVSAAYISSVINGKKNVTASVIGRFKIGGYKL